MRKLTKAETDHIAKTNHCPICDTGVYLGGPEGGGSQNLMCEQCGYEICWCGFSDDLLDRQEERASIYGYINANGSALPPFGKICVYLDDVRPAPEGFLRTKTVQQTIDLLQTKKVVVLSLDHDLGKDENDKELPDGYQVLLWIEKELVMNGFIVPEIIQIHSANVGAWSKMQSAIDQIQKLASK